MGIFSRILSKPFRLVSDVKKSEKGKRHRLRDSFADPGGDMTANQKMGEKLGEKS